MTPEKAFLVRDFLLVVDLMNEELANAELSPVDRGRIRGHWLFKSLEALALVHGTELKGPMHIDSSGEFSIQGGPGSDGVGFNTSRPLGAFAAVLNDYSPRTGVQPGAILSETSSWCYMNHFQVERMVTEKAAEARPLWSEYVMHLRIGQAEAQSPEKSTRTPVRRPKAV